MKKLFLPLMIIAAFVAFYEQNKPQPNQYIFNWMYCCFYVWNDAIDVESAKQKP